ncbi:MAG: hypothetical protein HYY44_03995 [Deltaproteobacteria bacterium]|nr:hypothetical protein [Deltaproteobacteria bacterium]
MFKFLFHRTAPLVRLLELIGVVNSFLFLKERNFDLFMALYLFLLIAYFFIRICDTLRWYSKEEVTRWGRIIGIRVHFQKALVPTSYILVIVSTIALLGTGWLQTAVVLLADLCLLLITSVNVILIWFHLNNREELPINYFSLGNHNSPPSPSLTLREGATKGAK